ncbi:hypothetical protein [Flavobacterium magnum]|nr:hypothetical protein [Flavobacterium magnum]
MTNFQTKFNYFIFVLRIILTLFAGSMLIFTVIVSPSLLETEKDSFAIISGVILFALLWGFLCYRVAKLVFTQIHIFDFKNHELTIINAITKVEKQIKLDEIRGFSTSQYQTRVWDFKSVIIYYENGRKEELPQFLYLNFKKIPVALEAIGINNFGYEPFVWKFFDSRHYKY